MWDKCTVHELREKTFVACMDIDNFVYTWSLNQELPETDLNTKFSKQTHQVFRHQ